MNITEVYGIEDDEILTQDIFAFEQTGFVNGKVAGELKPTGIRPTFMGIFKANGIALPPGEFGIPPIDPTKPIPKAKTRFQSFESTAAAAVRAAKIGLGKAVKAGGMVYVSAIGPVDPESRQVVSGGVKEQTRQCMENLKARLEAEGSSLEKIVWANWALKDSTEFDTFNTEWIRWFPDEPPVGQGTLMSMTQRREGFRVTLGVIAQA